MKAVSGTQEETNNQCFDHKVGSVVNKPKGYLFEKMVWDGMAVNSHQNGSHMCKKGFEDTF